MTVRPLYFDTSALRPVFLHEARSRNVVRFIKPLGGIIHITRFGYAELVNAMAGAVFRKDISAGELSAALAQVETDLQSHRLMLTDLLWRAALDRAVELSRKHTPSLGNRMLDVLHVASALQLDAKIFLSYDERQIKLARSVGLRTVSP